jgi:hypothetical protein
VNAASLTQVVGFLVALGGLSGLIMFFVSRWDKKRDPVSKAEAEVALAAKALGLAEGINDRLVAEVGRLDDKIEAMEARHAAEREEDQTRHAAEREQLLTKITGLERQIGAMIEDRDKTFQFLLVLRAWAGAGAKPPIPALPTHLREVIPEWVPGDGAEPPKPRLNPSDETHG